MSHSSKVLRFFGCGLIAGLVLTHAAGADAQVAIPQGSGVFPGVVIVDPTLSRGQQMASRLVRAGFATLVTASDPVAGAAILRRHSGVRSDDVAVVGYGEGASSVLAAIAERFQDEVLRSPPFRSAVAFGPDCARRYGDWAGHPAARAGTQGSTGAPHRGDNPTAGLYRTATPLMIVGGQGTCAELARESFAHEFFVAYSAADDTASVLAFLTENAQYSKISFPSSRPGTTLIGELTMPTGARAPAVIISPGTAGIEGFSFWERPWARRLHALGFGALIVDSYSARGSTWKNHWRIDARTTKARDLLDARAYLAKQSFVRAQSIGLLGRSSGGTAVLAAIVQDARAPVQPPPFSLDVRPPFSVAVADYGYCQLAYGAWPGGTPAPSAAIAYRTSVPLLIQVGANDTTVSARACEALAASVSAAGRRIELEVYPGVGHRFDAGVVETPPSTVRASVRRITQFIEAHSGR
jgi:dienelactone hydrolase